MKIKVLHQTERYVMISAPLLDDGSEPTRSTILPMLEALRGIGLRFVELHAPANERPAVICEREGDFIERAKLLGWEVQNG